MPLDRTAFALDQNAQLLEDEGLGPDPALHRLRSKEELSQAEKVKTRPWPLGQGELLSQGRTPSSP